MSSAEKSNFVEYVNKSVQGVLRRDGLLTRVLMLEVFWM